MDLPEQLVYLDSTARPVVRDHLVFLVCREILDSLVPLALKAFLVHQDRLVQQAFRAVQEILAQLVSLDLVSKAL